MRVEDRCIFILLKKLIGSRNQLVGSLEPGIVREMLDCEKHEKTSCTHYFDVYIVGLVEDLVNGVNDLGHFVHKLIWFVLLVHCLPELLQHRGINLYFTHTFIRDCL